MLPSFIVLAIAGAAVATPLIARQNANAFIAPLPTDRRSPCPMVNAVANHGFLPRDGLNISLAQLITAFGDSVNLAETATIIVGVVALTTSTTGDFTTFNLDDVNKHGIIEHDGSLSRKDVAFGDNHSFNKEIFDSVAATWTKDTIDIRQAAATRKARLAAAKAANPQFDLGLIGTQFSFIESALYLNALGDGFSAPTKYVTTLFREERLPYDEGWTKSKSPITATGLLGTVGLLQLASL